MGTTVVTLALSFTAGMLTALSPCVLPALPLVVGSAASGRRHGPLLLAAGLASSFTLVGVALAATGSFAGLGETGLRRGASLMLLAAGIALVSARVQDALSRLMSPLATYASRLTGRMGRGLAGQYAVGALLGVVWSPCVGPTLGAAIGLASSASALSLAQAAASMFAFGVGSAVPLLATAYASRRVLATRRMLLTTGATGKLVLGGALLVLGTLVLTGLDKTVEATVLARLPQWWIELLASV